MKILIITPWYPNRIHTQDGNFVRHQVEVLAVEHSVEVCCVVEDKAAPSGVQAGTRVQEIVEEGNVRVIRAYYAGGGNRASRILRRWRAWRAALKHRRLAPDLIHAHVLIDGGIIASELAHKLGIPYVVTEHSHRYLEPWPILRLPELWLARRAAARAAALIPVSPSLQRGMEAHKIKATYNVIPNVVKSDLFFPEKRTTAPFTFVHVSDFSSNKNIPLLLEAFAVVAKAHPTAQLRIAGNGDHLALVALAQTLHPAFGRDRNLRPRQLTITGPHEPQEIAAILRQSDVFVLCSNLETQSLVLIEALLCGLPCLSSRSGGPADIIVHPDQGALFPPGDKAALVAAMLAQIAAGASPLTDRQLRSQAAREKFGHPAEQFRNLYKNIMT